MKKFTVITKEGSKWLRTESPYNPETEPASTRWFHEEKCPDLLYIGNHPEGTTLDESGVSEVRQWKHHLSCIWNNDTNTSWCDDHPEYETRTVYIDAESHDRHISDDYWKRRCEAAENYINESPCDPDITRAQKAAYEAWQEIIKQEQNENI